MSSQLMTLQSKKTSHRLEQIARLRARGIGEHVHLPQLVVCGDQSAGKSSVLEGVTGIPFPRQDGLCTRFATEIVLTHTARTTTIVATIIPHATRSEESIGALRGFRKDVESFDDLSCVIEEAGALMGIRGYGGVSQGPSFTSDILRISVSGATGTQLSVVDLPGLISVASEDQTENDMQIVHDLVDSYVQNPRTIILAVVQANNDIANQGIIQKSKKFDPVGQRTVGIITKPDLINVGTEDKIARLARNQDSTKLKLGFFLLKNPSPAELQDGCPMENRELAEKLYFSRRPWNEVGLEQDRLGVANLRVYLQRLLDRHMDNELPNVKREIKSLIARVERNVEDLGEARPTSTHIRIFVSRLAMRFHAITLAALHGDYAAIDAEFFNASANAPQDVRLRAWIHNCNTKFAKKMQQYGHTIMIVTGDDSAGCDSADDDNEENDHGQTEMTLEGFKTFILEVYRRSRGLELPGNYNHVLLSELFHHQSKNWGAIAAAHVQDVARSLETFVDSVVAYITPDERIQQQILQRVEVKMIADVRDAKAELKKLNVDRDGPPMTYNHYYTDNVQNARHESTREMIKKALDDTSSLDYNNRLHISNTPVDAGRLLGALQKRVLVNMDAQACSEAHQALDAYYKVARKTFVDNVCVQVIERHLIRELPLLFSPEQVAEFTEEELFELAGETDTMIAKRRDLGELLSSLRASLIDLQM